MAQKSIIVKDSTSVLDGMLEDGWEVKSMCPLNPAVSIATGGSSFHKAVEHGSALVILYRTNF